mmetsp:Transcript_7851/g.23712  ORF Transcript_7851/g.23712 Transcript_7851/m.23712 type:complete len:170 (-) Transcript_7851:11-520(-)
MKVSKGETEYIVDGAAANLRGDGRSVLEFRQVVLETGIIQSASGSARARIGNTDVIAGVKAELGEPGDPATDEGTLNFSVECSSVASMEFEKRGGSALNAELATSMERLYLNNAAVDRRKLCLVRGKISWNVYIDVTVVQADGNLLDSASIAVRAAMKNAAVPRVKVIE